MLGERDAEAASLRKPQVTSRCGYAHDAGRVECIESSGSASALSASLAG